jgi:hypothetical protein
MKKLLIASAVALSLASAGASAAVISAGGISWDDTNIGPGGVSAQVNFQQWFAAPGTATTTDTNSTLTTDDDYQRITSDSAVTGVLGSELVGIGEFYSFNDGRDPAAFCDSGSCELTFAFGGLTVLSLASPGVSATFDSSNAWFNIYIDESPNFDSLGVADTTLASTAHTKFAEAQDGNLWAALGFDAFILDGTLIGGESEAVLSVRNIAGLGLDEAKAAWNYNNLFGSDVGFTAGATFLPNNLYTLDGNGQVIGVPEPSTIALFGLGLLGLAAGARRKRS